MMLLHIIIFYLPARGTIPFFMSMKYLISCIGSPLPDRMWFILSVCLSVCLMALGEAAKLVRYDFSSSYHQIDRLCFLSLQLAEIFFNIYIVLIFPSMVRKLIQRRHKFIYNIYRRELT